MLVQWKFQSQNKRKIESKWTGLITFSSKWTGLNFWKNKEVSYRSNRVSKKVRVPNIRATNVLRCSNAPDLKADSESVRIFEISQQMPKIPTFSSKKGGKKQKKFSGFLTSVPYRSHTGKERKKKSCQEQSSALGILIFSVKFYQLFAKTIRWSLENLKNWKISKKKLIWIHIGRQKRRNENLEEMSKWTRLLFQ